jgi:hypothetical protein
MRCLNNKEGTKIVEELFLQTVHLASDIIAVENRAKSLVDPNIFVVFHDELVNVAGRLVGYPAHANDMKEGSSQEVNPGFQDNQAHEMKYRQISAACIRKYDQPTDVQSAFRWAMEFLTKEFKMPQVVTSTSMRALSDLVVEHKFSRDRLRFKIFFQPSAMEITDLKQFLDDHIGFSSLPFAAIQTTAKQYLKDHVERFCGRAVFFFSDFLTVCNYICIVEFIRSLAKHLAL